MKLVFCVNGFWPWVVTFRRSLLWSLTTKDTQISFRKWKQRRRSSGVPITKLTDLELLFCKLTELFRRALMKCKKSKGWIKRRWLTTLKKEKAFLIRFTQGLRMRSVKCRKRLNNPRKQSLNTRKICRLEKTWLRKLNHASRTERLQSIRTPRPRRLRSRMQSSTTKWQKRLRKRTTINSFRSKKRNQPIYHLSILKNWKKESPKKFNFNAEKNAKAS